MREFVYEVALRQGSGIQIQRFTGPGECAAYSLTERFDGERLTVTLIPRKPLKLQSFTAQTVWSCGKEDRILLNGYQSWTDTRELTVRDRMHGINRIPKVLLEKFAFDGYGDYNMVKYSGKKGMLHGFSFGYIRRGDHYDFVGSLNERTGYTILKFQGEAQGLTLEKDCEGLEISNPYTVLDVAFLKGGYDEVFDRWFALQRIEKPRVKPMSGYTSWYNHYENITEQIIRDNLESMKTLPVKADIFQIDDGFEEAVGDWLRVDEKKFPGGMKAAADAIHQEGMLAGLWLAPFVCETKSHIFREHPDWLRRDEKGNPVKCGSNWSGFYALDLYNPEVVAYLEQVFRRVLDEWGFDMVKLDFLYAADRVAAPDRTRGQQMCEAMDLLRRLVGEKLILGCGVPLVPAFGKVDFCRVGCDAGLDWDDQPFMRLMHRERVSTKNTICDTVYRRGLDGRAFLNDPDVFLLRDENLKLSKKRKLQLAQVNGLFGSLRFTSDQYRNYDDEKWETYKRVLELKNAQVTSVTDTRKELVIAYREKGEEKQLKIRL